MERKYKLIIFGATGFTGKLVAEYIAINERLSPKDWAIAGRSLSKLKSVQKDLSAIIGTDIDIISADSSDATSLTAMTEQSNVIVSTVGPYALYGEPLVKACLSTGTHYLDITGEPNFVASLRSKYHKEAIEKNVLIINCCGFDSIPADLGAYYTASQFSGSSPLTIKGFVFSKGTFSGGTWASALNAMGEGLKGSKSKRDKRKRRLNNQVHFDKAAKKWAIPMPVIDPQMVARSADMLPDIYGNDFEYGQYIGVKSPFTAAGLVGGVGLIYVGAQFGPIRELLVNFRPSGEGPSPEERAKSFFRLTFYATDGTKKIKATVKGGDPGYTETSKMLSESALTVIEQYNDLKFKGGVLPPAGALGQLLLDRLINAGIDFDHEEIG